jgi:hypothetical protein
MRDVRRIKASVSLLQRTVDGQHLFAMATPNPVGNPCADKDDGAPCGPAYPGCTCLSHQEWYGQQAMADRGFRIEGFGED